MSRCDAVVLLTDGVNNLLAKQMPDLGAVGVAAVPLHVPLPPTGFNANLALLRWLAYQTGGSAATRLDEPRAFADAVSGAATQTVRTRNAPPPPTPLRPLRPLRPLHPLRPCTLCSLAPLCTPLCTSLCLSVHPI